MGIPNRSTISSLATLTAAMMSSTLLLFARPLPSSRGGHVFMYRNGHLPGSSGRPRSLKGICPGASLAIHSVPTFPTIGLPM